LKDEAMAEIPISITQDDVADAENVQIKEENESWNTYKLSDGSVIKVKLVITNVKRLKKFQPDGHPIYLIQSQNVVRLDSVPKELMGKPIQAPTKMSGTHIR
jgi:hypothetical protein